MRLARIVPCLLLAGKLASSTPLEVTLFPAAKTSFATLAVPVGVRATSMGGAYTALASDLSALQWNPAGLAKLTGYQLGFAHNEWSSELGLRQELLAYGQGLGRASGLAASANYFNLGKLDQRDANGGLLGESEAFSLAASLGYGRAWLRDGRLKLGLAAEFAAESLFGGLSARLGGTLGLIYTWGQAFNVGLAIKQVGGQGAFMPPSTLDMGIAFRGAKQRLSSALDLGLPLHGDPQIRLGGEYDFGMLAIRGGWRQALGAQAGEVQSGPSAGLGLELGSFSLDYAFNPYGQLASSHRMSLTLALPAEYFRPRNADAGHSTATSKAFFERASAKDKSGAMMDAMIEYQRSVESYPLEQIQGEPHEFYLEAKRRIPALRSKMSDTGQSEGARNQIKKYLAEGQARLADKKFKGAMASAHAALNLDHANPEALKLRQDAERALDLRKELLASDADDSLQDGELARAVILRREILKIDSDDAPSKAFFNGNAAQILALLKKIHRSGIEAYVNGRMEDAVVLWEDGLRIDPSDPLDMGRDLDKAKRLLGLRSSK